MALDYRGESDERSIYAHGQCDKLRYWLMWATANNLREGKVDEAGETILAMARLGRTFQSHHPGYYRGFMQCGLNATWELLQSGATNDQQLTALQSIWSKGSIVPDFPRFDEVHRAWHLQRIEAQHWGKHRDNSVAAKMYRLELENCSLAGAALWYLAGRHFDEYAYLAISQNRLRLTRTVTESRCWSSWPGESWPKQILWFLPWAGELRFALREHDIHEGMLRSVEFETQREMTVAAIALQRYRLRHGQWPDTLNDLVPEFLAELPRDWMDGQPLRYRRSANDTFTLYSVGEDLHDDGGDLAPIINGNMDAHPQPMWTTHNAVWPLVATKETVDALKKAASDKKQNPQPQVYW